MKNMYTKLDNIFLDARVISIHKIYMYAYSSKVFLILRACIKNWAIQYTIKCLREKTFVVFVDFANRKCFTTETFHAL